MICPFCGKPGEVINRPENDNHGMPMCADCSELQEIQPRMCIVDNEYGLILRKSGVWICQDCGLLSSDEESIQEYRIASSAEDDE